MSSNDRPVYSPSSHELPNIVGIDVGYGNTKVYGTAIGDRNREQSFHFPSLAVRVAGMTEKNPIGAKYQVTRVWSDGQEYFVGTDAPRLVQRPLRSSLERTYPLTPEYKALVLGSLYRAGLQNVDVLALGLPAQFSQDTELIEQMQARFLGDHDCNVSRVSVHKVGSIKK